MPDAARSRPPTRKADGSRAGVCVPADWVAEADSARSRGGAWVRRCRLVYTGAGTSMRPAQRDEVGAASDTPTSVTCKYCR